MAKVGVDRILVGMICLTLVSVAMVIYLACCTLLAIEKMNQDMDRMCAPSGEIVKEEIQELGEEYGNL